jgi:hypothetical protein
MCQLQAKKNLTKKTTFKSRNLKVGICLQKLEKLEFANRNLKNRNLKSWNLPAET